MVRAFAGDSTMTSRRRRAPSVVLVSVTSLPVVVMRVVVLAAKTAVAHPPARPRPARAGDLDDVARRSGKRVRRHEDPPAHPRSPPRPAPRRLLPTPARRSRRAQGYTWPAVPPPRPTRPTGTTSAAGHRPAPSLRAAP